MLTSVGGMASGSIKAFYCFGENPAKTEPNLHHVQRCLESVEFMVGQDIFPNETNRYADVILPSAAWCEDDGTFTNSERRVNRVRKVKEPPGLARPNWWIFRELARRMGHEWASASAQEIWDDEISQSWRRSLGGIKYRAWRTTGSSGPVPTEDHPGTPVLHKGGNFAPRQGAASSRSSGRRRPRWPTASIHSC